jgi:hypothetical protein
MTEAFVTEESGDNGWMPIETLPECTDALVCVTHNVPRDKGDKRPSAGRGYVWDTVQWVDWYSKDDGWFSYPHLIHVPFPPTHWMPLPQPPEL